MFRVLPDVQLDFISDSVFRGTHWDPSLAAHFVLIHHGVDNLCMNRLRYSSAHVNHCQPRFAQPSGSASPTTMLVTSTLSPTHRLHVRWLCHLSVRSVHHRSRSWQTTIAVAAIKHVGRAHHPMFAYSDRLSTAYLTPTSAADLTLAFPSRAAQKVWLWLALSQTTGKSFDIQ